jgi:hypothetical protein
MAEATFEGAVETSKQLEEKLFSLRTRRDEIEASVTTAARELEAARVALIEGASGNRDAGAVTEAQARHTALTDALASLDAQIEATESRRSQAQTIEARSAATARVKSLAKQSTQHMEEINRLREAAGEALRPFIEKMEAELESLAGSRREFIGAMQAVVPGFATSRDYLGRKSPAAIQSADEVIARAEQEGADLTALRVAWAETGICIEDQAYPFGFSWPLKEPFGHEVQTAFNSVLAGKARDREKAQREQERAEKPK